MSQITCELTSRKYSRHLLTPNTKLMAIGSVKQFSVCAESGICAITELSNSESGSWWRKHIDRLSSLRSHSIYEEINYKFYAMRQKSNGYIVK